jgi:hypothetical protein
MFNALHTLLDMKLFLRVLVKKLERRGKREASKAIQHFITHGPTPWGRLPVHCPDKRLCAGALPKCREKSRHSRARETAGAE